MRIAIDRLRKFLAASAAAALVATLVLVGGAAGAPRAARADVAVLSLAETADAEPLEISLPATAELRTAAYRKPAPEPTEARTAVTAGATSVRAASTTGSEAKPSAGGELARARAILAGLIRKHPILKGTTVTIGSTPGGYQAVAYYQSGRIVISPTHTASLETILNHEVWHIIDWRDNGRIDWGENVPPKS